MRVLITLLILGFSLHSYSKTLVFNVNNPKPHVEVFFDDTVMWRNEPNYIKVSISGKYKIKRVVLKGGSTRIVGGKYLLKVERGFKTNLLIFLKSPDGKVSLAFQRMLKISEHKTPVPLVCGVASDSVINKTQLVQCATLTARDTVSGKSVHVNSFSIEYHNGDSLCKIKSRNNVLSIQMILAIKKYIKDGNVINFKDIEYTSPRGHPAKMKNMMIFINDPKTRRK